MLLVLCILVNAAIGVIFKLFGKYNIDNLSAIVVNYFVCVVTAYLTFRIDVIPLDLFEKKWFLIAVFLGFVFILIFNLVALTVQNFGIVIATIFQRMSLLAPAIIGILFFGESGDLNKWMAILLAVCSIVLLSYRKSQHSTKKTSIWLWLLPLATWFGSSIIDASLYLVEIKKIAPNGDVQFTSTLFLMAGLAGTILWSIRYLRTKKKSSRKDIYAGIILGIPNFFSIYLILLILAQGYEGSVFFPILNVGILSMAAIFGFVFFKEKISTTKKFGFALAILSIILLSNPFQ